MNIKTTNKYSDENKFKLVIETAYLDSFRKRNENIEHINYKIHYLLHKPFTFVNAYAKISKNKGALTKGIKSDEEIMRFFKISDAENISKQIKEDKYVWKPSRRTLIPKPGKKTKRPIDTFTQKDRIVQEALRGILECIYEPEFKHFEELNKFKSTNYGFRPRKSCWDALEKLKIHGQSANYVIEGDIVGAYNNVNHDILISILERRIKDKTFIKLINRFLKAGIMECNIQQHNLLGTPQGGILSPILFNIYMFELDKFVYNEIIQPINKLQENKTTKRNPKYVKKLREIKILRAKCKDMTDPYEINRCKKLIKIEGKNLFKLPSYDLDSLKIKPIYSRYADDWILLTNGDKESILKIKEQINDFIINDLKMELDEDKTLITPISKGINFLGFTLKMYSTKQIKLKKVVIKHLNTKKRTIRRTTSRKINIFPDKHRILKKLKEKKFCNNEYYPIGLRKWAIYDEYEIVLKYRQVMIGIFNYYSKCDNYYILNRIVYILLYSCAKTIAHRKKITMSQVFTKYGKDIAISKTFFINNKEVNRKIQLSSLKELKNKINISQRNLPLKEIDPLHIKEFWRTKMKIYLDCCICNSNENVGMHHINSLRSIKFNRRDKFEYIRSQINRIQIPVCTNCHLEITNGKYNKQNPIKFYNEYVAKL